METVRGKGGGLRLALDPPQIRIAPVCRLPAVLTRAFEALYAELDRHTLADLVARPGEFRQVLVLRQDDAALQR